MDSPKNHETTPSTSHRLGLGLFVCLIGAVLGLISLAATVARADTDRRAAFLVIVNAQNSAGAESDEFVSGAFLKKVSRWDDGETIQPVDLAPGSAVRRAFSESILKRPVAAVRRYWQQRIFSGGDVPPPEVDSDDAVVRYVAKYRGAVGYVSPSAKLGTDRVLAVH